MGNDDFLTPKAMANRMKAKGLQKLKWYCELCKKQCRDENGFKCHCMSEGHQQQMQLFMNDPDRLLNSFSDEFECQFLEHLKRSHQSTRIAATVVWNEYIANRHHIHMNSTRWVTLTEFVKHLGRTGKCKVDETPKGWFVTFIDPEPETTWENFRKKRPRAKLAKEQHQDKILTEQIEKATKSARYTHEQRSYEKTELQREDGEKIRFVLDATKYKSKGETHRLQKGETVALQLAKTSIFAESTVTPEHQSIGFGEAGR